MPRVKITPPKDIPQAKYGQAIPGSYGSAFDSRWNPVTFQGQISVNPKPDPFEKTKKTLPEVAPEDADINAEKHEMILGNFTPDGLPSLMDVDGPPHTEGGKFVATPPNSFVFSDTSKLKIKDPELLKQFGQTKSATPAKIAKKYDLQKFTKVLANPDSDEVSKKTAELMVQNYSSKLQQLASVQEQKKADMGLDNDLQQQQSQQPPMAQLGGYRGKQQVDIPGLTDLGYGITPYHGTKGTDWSAEEIAHRGEQYGWKHKEPLGEYMTREFPNVAQSMVDKEGKSNDWQSNNIQGPMYGKRYEMPPPARPTYSWDDPMENQDIPELPVTQLPATIPQPTNMSGNTDSTGDSIGSYKKTETKTPETKVPFTAPTPDKWGMQNSLLNAATIHRYPAWEAPIGAVAPNVIFEDPTRAIAAQQEAANSAAYNNALSGDSRTSRANNLYGQGIAGSEAANILGAVGNRNTQISNQASREVADISNKLMQEQANRLNRMYQGNVISSQQYDNAMREARNDITKQAQNMWNERSKLSLINDTSPYFYIDPVSGKRVFKSDEAKAHFNNEINRLSSGTGISSDTLSKYKQSYDAAIAKGLSPERSDKYAAEASGMTDREREKLDKYGVVQGSTTSKSAVEQYGGSTKKNYRIGGFTQRQLKKFIKLPS